MDRRTFVAGTAGLLASSAAMAQQGAAPRELRIGFQKSGVLLIAKARACSRSASPPRALR